MNSQAVAEAMVCSKSLARRRLRLSHAKVRSTTQRRGSTSKPLAVSDRLMISMVHLLFPILRSASRSLSPAYPPSAKTCRSHGKRSEEHTSELQSLMRISYAVFCLKKKTHAKTDMHPNVIVPHDINYRHPSAEGNKI